MNLRFIQNTLKELELERYNVHDLINKVLRIAQHKVDLDVIIYARLNKITINEDNVLQVFRELYKIAVKKKQNSSFKDLFEKIYQQVITMRTVDMYDVSTKKIEKNCIVASSISEMTSHLSHLEFLVGNNKLPEGLHTQDMYFANERKQQLDIAYFNQIGNYKSILNKVKEHLVDYLIRVETDMLEIEERENLDAKKELELLIEDGNKVFHQCIVRSQDGYLEYIKGSEYIAWIERSKSFIKTNISDKDIYEEFLSYSKNANGNDESHYEGMIGILTAVQGMELSNNQNTEAIKDTKIKKIFISHATKDKKYVGHLVQLLNDIGITKSDEKIFCSSLPGYDIPYGESIYDFLKGELNNSNIMVLFVLSNNYYKSAACLNEMGAAWVTSKAQNFILLPNFNFNQISGAIDASKISFNMDDEHGLDKFKDKIVEIFELENINYKIWNEDKAKFLEFINTLAKEDQAVMTSNIELEKVRKVESNLEFQLRLINNTDRAVEFKFIDIELTDSYGKTATFSLEDELDEFILYKNENKITNWSLPIGDKDISARRIENSRTRIKYEVS
ncbi:toll/interleukin-1 receptor domain-containing protein [Rossellomorea sp. LjRoot5]|uniref:toll/interleukin-1 receptor domain-containing protein n=1 Tax=Rossellomorea sp. LjRoot5 TaxID=3342331 RepID=UPI003ED16BD2